MRWTPDGFLALPEDAIAFAWSAPMRELAPEIGISDVALRKLFNTLGIVTPPQGHWNRVHAGRAPAPALKPPPRRPGETGRIRFDTRFRGHVAEAGPMPEEGPFATRNVPEALGELRTQELKALGRVVVPRDLARPHPGLARLLRKEDARRAKAAASRWHWDEAHFDTVLAQRKLRLLSGLFTALARRGHSGDVGEDREEIHAHCTIGDTTLWLHMAIIGRHRTEMRSGYDRPARDLPAKTPLRLALKRELRGAVTTVWQDEIGRPLEKQLAEIAADLIVAGEAAFRQGLVEAREEAERWRRWEEQRERERRERLNRERLGQLEASWALLRQADDLRALVERVGAAVERGGLTLGGEELEAWRTWALERADELDPVLSGQVLSHIRPRETE